MTATPADIARFTNDGQLITVNDPAIKAVHLNAQDVGTTELPMYFDNVADGLTMLNERFALLSMVGRTHDGVEINDSLGLGTSIPLAPSVPIFHIVDEQRGIDGYAAVKGYSFDMGSDKYAVELTGAPSPFAPSSHRWDTTAVTMDSSTSTFDEA